MNKVLLALTIFFLGWVGSSLAASITIPPINSGTDEQPFLENILSFAPERPSPSNWIEEHQIHVTKNKVTLDLRDAEWATFTDTNSMDPIIDDGSNAIEIVPERHDQLKVGDIISYESDYAEGTIIHRIVEIGDDGEWFARLKGDNLDFQDPGKIRFHQIKRVVVGILY
tara:strand:- start:2933 stop:3439 length:507 start_codon:yes stop_codon:yes gene_type:complete